MKPTILLVNDDGINSMGLLAMRKELEKLGNVVVVAPNDERSGTGKSISVHDPVKMVKTRLSDESEAYAITGTPADAALLGFYKILERPPDLLVSGINLGRNLGIGDFLSSGTIGATLEAAIHHVPAISASWCVKKDPAKGTIENNSLEELRLTAMITKMVAEYVLKNGMPKEVDILSINVPENADLKKIKTTLLSYKDYGGDIYIKRRGGYEIRGHLDDFPEAEPGTDLYAVRKEGYISITPIGLRFTHRKGELKDLLKFLLSSTK